MAASQNRQASSIGFPLFMGAALLGISAFLMWGSGMTHGEHVAGYLVAMAGAALLLFGLVTLGVLQALRIHSSDA